MALKYGMHTNTFTSPNVAAGVALSTITSNAAYRTLLETRPQSFATMFGGGHWRSKVFTVQDLASASLPEGGHVEWSHSEYSLSKFLPLPNLHACRRDWSAGDILCSIPLHVVIPRLDLSELKDLCKLHGIVNVYRSPKKHLLTSLSVHSCSDHCIESFALFTPIVPTRYDPIPIPVGTPDIESVAFASSFKTLALHEIQCLLPAVEGSLPTQGYKIKQIVKGLSVTVSAGDVALVNLPLRLLASHLTVPNLKVLAKHHRVLLKSSWNRQQCVKALEAHKCSECRSLTYILTPAAQKERKRCFKSHWVDVDESQLQWESEFVLPTDNYPPRPTTMQDIAKAMKGYCAELAPDVVSESGCSVCGQLTPKSQLVTSVSPSLELGILHENGAARELRQISDDLVRTQQGPILDLTAKGVCVGCHDSLLRGVRPKMALANHLWLGEIPECLKDLTLGEMALISRVRHNRCVVRVARGHTKMIANVISFEHPTMKIYDSLPMSPEDLDEVLSVVYTGMEPPTDHDKKRTPVLV